MRDSREHELAGGRTLIDTATAMFLERGFETVTVAEIATACDLSPATVFNHFPIK